MKKLRGIDFLSINIYWFSLSFFVNALGRFIQPVLVAALVDPTIKNTSLGFLRGGSLLVATLIQPLMGAISDRSTSRWGRRRPFILIGTLLDFVFLVLIALSGNYLFLFIAILFLQLSTNTAHGAVQGLIPDLVLQEQRGKAVGVKQFLEFLGLIVASQTIGGILDQANLFFQAGERGEGVASTLTAMAIIIAVLAAGMILTLFLVKEQPSPGGETSTRTGMVDTLRVDVRGNSQYFWLLGGRFSTLLGVAFITDFAVYYFADVVRVPNPVSVSGDLVATVAVLILLITYPAGYLTDRIGRKPLNLIAGPIAAVGGLGFLTVSNRTLFHLGPLAVTDILAWGSLIGLAIGAFLSANWTWATDLIPQGEAGKYLGLANLTNAGPGVVAGFLGGPLIDFFNSQAAGLGYNVAFASGAASFLLGTLLMLRVRETRQKGL